MNKADWWILVIFYQSLNFTDISARNIKNYQQHEVSSLRTKHWKLSIIFKINFQMWNVVIFVKCIYEVHTISFQIFFVRAFKIVVDSWKFSILLLYILWDDWPILMISGSNQQLQQQLEYTLLKPDCHCWWISKMQSDTLAERYAIQFLEKMPQKRMEGFRLLFDHHAWIEHQFLSGIRDTRKAPWKSVRDDEKCGRSKEVDRPELIGQRVRVRIAMSRF